MSFPAAAAVAVRVAAAVVVMMKGPQKRRFATTEDGRQLEWEWAKDLGKVTNRQAGSTGYARIVWCSDATMKPGASFRAHLCANNPCTAKWSLTSYSQHEPPIHLRTVPELGPAVAEPAAEGPTVAVAESVAAVEPAAVLEPAVVMQPAARVEPASMVEPAAVLEPAVEPAAMVEPAPIVEPGVQKGQVQAPGSPTRAALPWLQPPAPATPIVVCDEGDVSVAALAKTAVAETSCFSSAETTRLKIKATLLALARDIGRPRTYVGYSAFVLMGLLKKCQPFIWEGTSCIDLLQIFAPWAKESCPTILSTSAIACSLASRGSGSVEFAPISAEAPLGRTCHFVGGCPLPEPAVAEKEQPDSFEEFYAWLGIAAIRTVCDGDCGLDCMQNMLGLPSSFESRSALRAEISNYLIARLNERWMHELMVALQEVAQEDLDNAWCDGTLEIRKPLEVAPAVLEPAPQSAVAESVAAPSEEIFAAMRWASHMQTDSAVLSLIRSLPPAVVEEQVQLYGKRHETAVAKRANR